MRGGPAILMLVVLITVAGCIGGAPVAEETPDGEAIVERMADSEAELESVHGTLQITEYRDGETAMATAELWDRPPEPDQRLAFLEDGIDDRAGNVIVVNETTGWSYNETENEATRYDLTDSGLIIPLAEYGYYDEVVDDFEVSYEGTDDVADREVFVVTLSTPPEVEAERSIELLIGDTVYQIPLQTVAEDGFIVEEQQLLVDTEHYYPLGERATLEGPNGSVVGLERTFEEVSFEEPIDDDRFTFDPPADAEIDEVVPPDRRWFDDIESADEALDFDLVEPDPPAGFELEGINVTDWDDGPLLATITYLDPDANESVRVTARVDDDTIDRVDGIEIEIGDREGTLTSTLTGTAIWLECDEFAYSVTGDVEEETLLAVVESIDC